MERVGAGGQAGSQPCQALPGGLVLPYAGGKKEKVVNPRAGFNPKPGVGLDPQATIGEMDKYNKSFTPEKTEKTEVTIKMA